MNVGVEVKNLRPFQRALRKADREVQEGLKSRLRRAAGRVRDLATVLAPKKSGRLAGSMRPFSNMSSAGFKTTDPKAGVQEFAEKYRRRGRGGSHPMGPHTVTMRNVASKGPSGGRFAYKARDELEDWIEEEVYAAVVEAARAEGWLG